VTFPGSHSQIYRNEEGEVIGWDNPQYFEPEYDPDEYLPLDLHDEEDDESDVLRRTGDEEDASDDEASR
jgi:hypothetical protein